MIFDNLIIKFGANPWNPRGKYRLYKMLAAGSKTVEGLTPKGVRLRFRPDDGTCYFFFRDDYESLLTDLIATLPPGGVFVDVGANVGNYTIIGSRQVGHNGLVVAFEPIAETYARLTNHITINSASNVIPFNAAVAASEGIADMVYSDDSGLSYLGKIEVAESQKIQRVATVSLDHFLPALIGNREIDLIKIDVEGAEFGVIRGAEGLLDARIIKRLHVEIAARSTARSGTTREELWEFMETRGYRGRFRKTDGAMYDEIFDRV